MNVGAPFQAHSAAAEAIEPGQRAHTKVKKIQPWGQQLGRLTQNRRGVSCPTGTMGAK
jgi:hypothetical protein